MRQWGTEERIAITAQILGHITKEPMIRKAQWQAQVAIQVLSAPISELQANEKEIENCMKGYTRTA